MRTSPHSSKPTRKGPMATPVKKEKKLSVSLAGIRNLIWGPFTFIKNRLILSAGISVLIMLVLLVYVTPLFQITNIVYDFRDTAEDCVSKQLIESHYFEKPPKVWSYLSFDGEALKKKHPCLDSIAFRWNPFSFNTLSVVIMAAEPIASVIITRIDAVNPSGLGEQYFISPFLSEELRYLTKEGNFVSLVTAPDLPKFRYRVLKNAKMEDMKISQKDLKMLLQLQKYMKTEFDVSNTLDFAQDGSIRLSTPFSEEIYITLHDDLSIQLGSLQAILGTATIDKKKIRLIDLRFGNPVIHFR